MTIGELMTARLGGRAEYADRVTLGPIELIVRDVDEKGRIISRRRVAGAGRAGAARCRSSSAPARSATGCAGFSPQAASRPPSAADAATGHSRPRRRRCATTAAAIERLASIAGPRYGRARSSAFTKGDRNGRLSRPSTTSATSRASACWSASISTCPSPTARSPTRPASSASRRPSPNSPDKGAKVILLAHFGRPKGGPDAGILA